MDILDRLIDREIGVYVNGVCVKTIKRHVRRADAFKPTHGTVEVQKREWVKVHAISPEPFPRWRLSIDENQWLDVDATIKK